MLKFFRRKLFSSNTVSFHMADILPVLNPAVIQHHRLVANLTSAKTSPPLALQHLPVPPLDKTLDKYLRSVKPLLSEKNL